jgi:hypothetical protein
MSLLRLPLLLAFLCLAACTDPRSRATSLLRHADVTELRADVARLHTRLFLAPGSTIIAVRPEMWPAAIVKLRPLRMNLYRDGLAVTLQAEPGFEYGLHIAPTGPEEQLKSTARTQYEKIQEGIWYFSQKR